MRIRKLSVERLHKAFGDATLEWPNASPTTGLSHYTVKFGVPHLLVTQRAGDAIQQMLNLRYMVALLLACKIGQRNCWRSCWLVKARRSQACPCPPAPYSYIFTYIHFFRLLWALPPAGGAVFLLRPLFVQLWGLYSFLGSGSLCLPRFLFGSPSPRLYRWVFCQLAFSHGWDFFLRVFSHPLCLLWRGFLLYSLGLHG